MKHVTIIATSLSPESKSQKVARMLRSEITAEGVGCDLYDLRDLHLPMAGTEEGWSSADAAKLKAAVEASSHIVFAVPVYCYDVNAAAKNVIELIGRAFTKKVVSFVCAAGGSSSYMAVMGMMNHIMLGFRSVIVPRFLYVEPNSWDGENLKPEIKERMTQLIADMREVQVMPADV